MENPDFKQGIKKILATTNFRLSKNGIDLLNRIIQFLNAKLVHYCLDNSDKTMHINTARDAVDAIYMKNLKNCAFAEGNRILSLYSNGMVEYIPIKIVKKKKGKKALAIAALAFSRGVSDLTSLLFPDASLQDEAKRILCQVVEEMAVKVSDFVQSKSEKSITQHDVIAAAETILPQQILRHALAEGARMTFLFRTGMLKEPSRRRSVTEVKMEYVHKRAAPVSEKRSRSRKTVSESPTRRKVSRKRRVSRKASRTVPKKRATRKISRESRVSRKAPRTLSGKRKTRKTGVSRKALRRVSRKRKTGVSRKAPRTVSRKRKRRKTDVSRKAPRPVSRKRKAHKPGVSRKAPRRISRKRKARGTGVSRKAPRRVSRKRKARETSVSRKVPRRVSRKRKTRESGSRKKYAPKKRRVRESPKKIKRIIRKKSAKAQVVSEKVTTLKTTTTTLGEIIRGTRKLNKTLRQRLSVSAEKFIGEFLSNLLNYLIAEMRKNKYFTIGPLEVKKAIMKVLPQHLADLAVANMSRAIMTNLL